MREKEWELRSESGKGKEEGRNEREWWRKGL